MAGVDYAVGAPSGMALVTYTPDVEALMHARTAPPPTSYLDLLQLQAYWSPERLNHHTAPTSLIYGLREALRLVHEEGLLDRWLRHRQVGQALRQGLEALGLEVERRRPVRHRHAAGARRRGDGPAQTAGAVRRLRAAGWPSGRGGSACWAPTRGPMPCGRVVTGFDSVLKEAA